MITLSEEPVRDIDLVSRELGGQTSGIFGVEPPVDDPFELQRGGWPADLVILIPLGPNGRDLANPVTVDHVSRLLVQGRIVTLMTDLENDIFSFERLGSALNQVDNVLVFTDCKAIAFSQ